MKDRNKLLKLNKLRLIFLFIMLLSFISYTFSVLASGDGGTPLIELKSPFNNKIDLDGNIIFAYNVTDPVADISNCSLIFDGIINQTDSTINKSIIQYFTLNSISNGDYNWNINCTNNVGDGNGSESWNITVFIDTTVPTVTLNGPADGSTDTDGNIIFNYTVNDNGWITTCSLYTDISGTWQINQTSNFVQKNASSYFEVNNIPDDTTFKWNVQCHDFALSPNSDWADANWTITIDNTAPTYSTIPDQTWDEDTTQTINLSNYFSDIDDNALTYGSTSLNNIDISIDNSTGIVTLNPDLNWNGKETIVFYAFDIMEQSATSNTITLIVNPGTDNSPRITFASPSNNSIDSDGYVFINCSAFDDYNLVNISLYTDIGGVWEINQTKNISGNYDSALFNLTDLSDGSYGWNCLAYDNASQSGWGENRTFDVSITAEIEHDISSFTINHIDHNRTVMITYSSYINDSLTLGNLTIYLSNGSIYFNKDMSTNSGFEINSTDPPLIIHSEKIRIKYNEIFYGNFTVGNEEWLNITQEYYYRDNVYETSEKQTIEIKSALPIP